MDSKEIRLKNMRELANRAGSMAELARKMDMAPQLIQHYIGKTPIKAIGGGTARKAEEAFGLPRGWLDNDHSAATKEVCDWPFFEISRQEWECIPERVKGMIEGYAKRIIAEHPQSAQKGAHLNLKWPETGSGIRLEAMPRPQQVVKEDAHAHRERDKVNA